MVRLGNFLVNGADIQAEATKGNGRLAPMGCRNHSAVPDEGVLSHQASAPSQYLTG